MRSSSRTARQLALLTPLLFGFGACGDVPSEEPLAPHADPLGPEELRARTLTRFELADWLKPRMEGPATLDPYLAPLIYIETSAEAEASTTTLPGSLHLTAAGLLEVSDSPTVYFDEDSVRIGERDHRQLSFLWFREPLGTGRVSAQGLRITFDRAGFPALTEVLVDASGCSILYASSALEQAAVQEFGTTFSGRAYVLERGLAETERVVLADTLADAPAPMGPYLYLPTDSNDIVALHCRCSATQADEIREAIEYELVPLESLEGVWPLSEAGGFGPRDAVTRWLRLPATL